MMMTTLNTKGKMAYGGQVTSGYCFANLNYVSRSDLIYCFASTFVEYECEYQCWVKRVQVWNYVYCKDKC